MNIVVTYDRDEKELAQLRRIEKEVAAKKSEEMWEFAYFQRLQMLREYVQNTGMIDITYFELRDKKDILAVAELRRVHKKVLLALITSPDISPVEYMRPDIMAASLLLRPLTKEKIESAVQEMTAAYIAEKSEDICYVIRNKEGSYSIPVSEILWFEARQKKVFLRTKREEIGFYATLDELINQLPETFLRVHKSYIVNLARVRSARFSDNTICMTDGSALPISRSYKTEVKQRI